MKNTKASKSQSLAARAGSLLSDQRGEASAVMWVALIVIVVLVLVAGKPLMTLIKTKITAQQGQFETATSETATSI